MAVPTTKKPTRKPTKAEGRKKSRLVTIGEEAMRRALLEALVQADWNLSAAAKALGVHPTHVHRYIRQLGLQEAYDSVRVRRITGKA